MADPERIGVAIAGCGKIARVRHAPEYNQNPNVVIRGFYDRSSERAEELAREYGGRVYDSYEELLADTSVDAVSVCTPNFLHKEYSVLALEAGKHVFCEKPMASSLEEADEMLAVQIKAGRILMPGHNQRFIPAHIRAKELLDAGVIGRIISVTANFKHGGPENWSVSEKNTWFFSKEYANFGVLGDLGSHKVDLVRYLLDDEISEIFASLLTLDKHRPDGSLIDLDDNAYCIFKTAKGIPGTIAVSWTNYGPEDNATIIYGSKGCMKIFSSETDDIVIQLEDGTDTRLNAGGISTNKEQLNSGIIDAFVDTVLGYRELLVEVRDGRNTLACLEAARLSAESGQWVKVNNVSLVRA